MAIDRSTPALGSLFQGLILEHYTRPRYRGAIAGAPTVHLKNPTCGDEILLGLMLYADGRLAVVYFLGGGGSLLPA